MATRAKKRLAKGNNKPLKKTPLKQVGKQGRMNHRANKKIKQMWIEKDIRFCEACEVLNGLGHLGWQCGQASSNAHRHERLWYRSQPEKLHSFKQVIRACQKSHTFIDQNRDIRERVFIKLRGEE